MEVSKYSKRRPPPLQYTRRAYLESSLGCLVDGNAGRASQNVGLSTQSSTQLNCIGTVKTSRAVVPALERRVSQGSLSDGDSLPLATAHTSDKVVANTCVLGVRDAEDSHDNITHMLCVLALVEALGDVPGASGASGEVQRVVDGEIGEVIIDLSGIDGLSLVSCLHLLGADTLEVQCGFIADMESVCITRDGAKKCRAAGAGRAKNTEHLTALYHAFQAS